MHPVIEFQADQTISDKGLQMKELLSCMTNLASMIGALNFDLIQSSISQIYHQMHINEKRQQARFDMLNRQNEE